MGQDTKIQWTDYTLNFWMGCTKISPGCQNCYAETATPVRTGGLKWGRGQPRKRTKYWVDAMRWNRKARAAELDAIDDSLHDFGEDEYVPQKLPNRPRVFVNSLSDWLDPEVPILWLAEAMEIVRLCTNLDFQLLTKRPEKWRERMQAVHDLRPGTALAVWVSDWLDGTPPENVWVGTTAENQHYLDIRVPELVMIPALVRFVSAEPLLGPLKFSMLMRRFVMVPGIHWVIVGGESGNDARPCDIAWIESIVRQCHNGNVACFVKQLGAEPVAYGAPLVLKHKKGGDPDEWPEHLRVLQFPGEAVRS